MQGIPLTISLGFLYIWKGLSWRHEWVSISFARVPLGSLGFTSVWKVHPLGLTFMVLIKSAKHFIGFPQDFIACSFILLCRGAPCEVIKLAYIIQGVLLNMSEDFQNTFCKGHPLGFHWIPIWSSLATPIILQWVPLRINFVVSIHFARVPLLTISSDLLSFWKKRWSSRYQWSSIYFAGDTLWFHSVSICLQGGGGTP